MPFNSEEFNSGVFNSPGEDVTDTTPASTTVSRFGGVEAFILGLLSPAVDSGLIAEARIVTAKGILATPGAYPSVFVCSDPPIRIAEDAGGSHTTLTYSQMTALIIRVSSDGIQTGDAKQAAWVLFDSVVDLVHNQHPIGAPVGTTFDVLIPGTPIEIDNVGPMEYGILIPIETHIYRNK